MTVGLEQLVTRLRGRAQERAEAGRLRVARLRGVLPDAARLLRDRHGARRVVLFGSLRGTAVTEFSDVDLAVEGLTSDRYFEALAELMALFGGPVDLVRLETAPQSLRERIAADGEAW